MPLPTIPFEGEPTKENITDKLNEWIITLAFAPGEKIADTDIASYFGVSRTPVREVLKILEHQKLIVTYPGRATVVAELNPNKIEEPYIPMRSLQCLAVKMAADRANAQDVAELIELNEDFYVKMLRRDEDAFSVLMADRMFHRKIEELSGNDYISDFCSTLWPHVARMDYIFFKESTALSESYNDHLEMINAIRMKDPFAAEIAMQNNWTNSMLGIMGIVGTD